MRRGLLIFWLINLIIVGLLVNYVFTLITLLFEDYSADAIPIAEITNDSEFMGQLPQYIPKILHQTWKNDSIPLKWQEAQKSCLDLHQDYEYKVCFGISGWVLVKNRG
jgi:mannosyltransferase OCH1-like enzyme